MESKDSKLNSQDLISIVLTNYNRKDYIIEQLESILDQTHKNWELIIADDCSTDGSAEIIKKFIEKNRNRRITFIRNEKNIGVAKNFEKGLGYASGKYIAVSDSDDVWLSDKLEKELKFLKGGNFGMVYSDLKVVDANLKVTRKSFIRNGLSFFCNRKDNSFYELINDNHVPGPTILFQAEFKNRLIPFSRYAIQDYWIAIIFSIFSTIGYLDEPTVLYRQHSENMVGAGNISPIKLILKKNKIFLEKHLEMKKNAILFLKDLACVKGINEEILEKINEKIEKLDVLIEGLSLLKENKLTFWKYFLKFWKMNAYRELLQLIYFKLYLNYTR